MKNTIMVNIGATTRNPGTPCRMILKGTKEDPPMTAARG